MAYVTDAVRELTQNRIRAGVAWLDENAPLLWRRNMYGIRNYRAIFRAKNQLNDAGVLALAFESREDLANSIGYVTRTSIAGEFDLSTQTLKNLGFKIDKDCGVTTTLLNEEWREYLRADVESISLGPENHHQGKTENA